TAAVCWPTPSIPAGCARTWAALRLRDPFSRVSPRPCGWLHFPMMDLRAASSATAVPFHGDACVAFPALTAIGGSESAAVGRGGRGRPVVGCVNRDQIDEVGERQPLPRTGIRRDEARHQEGEESAPHCPDDGQTPSVRSSIATSPPLVGLKVCLPRKRNRNLPAIVRTAPMRASSVRLVR